MIRTFREIRAIRARHTIAMAVDCDDGLAVYFVSRSTDSDAL